MVVIRILCLLYFRNFIIKEEVVFYLRIIFLKFGRNISFKKWDLLEIFGVCLNLGIGWFMDVIGCLNLESYWIIF